ncbi:MAG: DUF1810 domain-containing protein [Ruegeria sp.]|uniref:DUF1810 domain-containing protein n=1 Tax=Ruegeria sp. TaxID=1879320 RepID=UPI00349EFCFF
MSGLDPDLFITAQDRVWPSVLKELEQGQKTSHWMWFVFPQLSALGRSPTAQRYGIADLDQAADYLTHPVLRDRLIEVSRLMLSHSGTSASAILGPVDAMKLRSSMTLFSLTKNAPPEFRQVLDTFYEGPCPLTLQLTST